MEIKKAGAEYVRQTNLQEKSQKAEGGSFHEKLSAVSGMNTQELMQEIQNRKDEIYTKAKRGELEERFQIGSQSYTIKEWNKLLDIFDGSQDKLKSLLEEKLEQQKAAERGEVCHDN